MNDIHHTELEPGTKVYYHAEHKKENGIVKSIRDPENAFVVYHCAGQWNNYMNYTGALTPIKDLKLGWFDDEVKCNHEFFSSGGKWSPINQMTCIYCGKVINN